MMFGAHGCYRPLPRLSICVMATGLLSSCLILAGCMTRSVSAPVLDLTENPTSPASHRKHSATVSHPVDHPVLAPHPMPSTESSFEPTLLPPLPDKSAAPAETSQPSLPLSSPNGKTINWAWPVKGQMIQAFNPNTKGIDISGHVGKDIRAAADGKVMYSGNGVRGLGNLIIMNHRHGFITAYAHNRVLLVKAGQEVTRGTQIAEMGMSDTISPRLHFEIRYQGKPVNPLQYLPAQ